IGRYGDGSGRGLARTVRDSSVMKRAARSGALAGGGAGARAVPVAIAPAAGLGWSASAMSSGWAPLRWTASGGADLAIAFPAVSVDAAAPGTGRGRRLRDEAVVDAGEGDPVVRAGGSCALSRIHIRSPRTTSSRTPAPPPASDHDRRRKSERGVV